LATGAGEPKGVVGKNGSEAAEFDPADDALDDAAVSAVAGASLDGAGSAAAAFPCGRRRELTTGGGAAAAGRLIGTACGGVCGNEACGAAVLVDVPPEAATGERVTMVEPVPVDVLLRTVPKALNCGAVLPEVVLEAAPPPPAPVVRVLPPAGARLKFEPCRDCWSRVLGRGISGGASASEG
jgi:hypothetical protein